MRKAVIKRKKKPKDDIDAPVWIAVRNQYPKHHGPTTRIQVPTSCADLIFLFKSSSGNICPQSDEEFVSALLPPDTFYLFMRGTDGVYRPLYCVSQTFDEVLIWGKKYPLAEIEVKMFRENTVFAPDSWHGPSIIAPTGARFVLFPLPQPCPSCGKKLTVDDKGKISCSSRKCKVSFLKARPTANPDNHYHWK